MNKPRSYLFVDGNYFIQYALAFGKRNFPDISLTDFIDFSRIGKDHERSFFFDAPPPNPDEEKFRAKWQEKDELFTIVNLTPNFRVVSGLSRKSGNSGRLRQKGVDILLAISELQQAVNGNMDIATFIAGDLDFLPIFDALSTTRIRTKLISDPSNTASELVYSADQIEPLTAFLLQQWMTDQARELCGGLSSHSGEPTDITDLEVGVLNGKRFSVGRRSTTGSFVAFIEKSGLYRECRNKEALLDWFYEYPDKKVCLSNQHT